MTRRRTPGRRPRGIVIVPALVCLVLVGLIGGVVMKQVVTRRAAVRAEERRLRAEWLAESGLARARARLAAPGDYRGETWEPSDGPREGPGARVRIAVEPVADAPRRRRVVVEASDPRGGVAPVRQTKSVTLDLGPETPGGSSRP